MEEALREAESQHRLPLERLPVAAYSQVIADQGGSFYDMGLGTMAQAGIAADSMRPRP